MDNSLAESTHYLGYSTLVLLFLFSVIFDHDLLFVSICVYVYINMKYLCRVFFLKKLPTNSINFINSIWSCMKIGCCFTGLLGLFLKMIAEACFWCFLFNCSLSLNKKFWQALLSTYLQMIWEHGVLSI